jgi:hypothetical protein
MLRAVIYLWSFGALLPRSSLPEDSSVIDTGEDLELVSRQSSVAVFNSTLVNISGGSMMWQVRIEDKEGAPQSVLTR